MSCLPGVSVPRALKGAMFGLFLALHAFACVHPEYAHGEYHGQEVRVAGPVHTYAQAR